MFFRIRLVSASSLLIACFVLLCQPTSAQERLCDPSFEDCYTPLLDLVRAENVGIDIEFYMIELPDLANAIISRHQAGVSVRIIVEPRANLKFPENQPLLDKFKAAGIPMRYKLGDGFVHVKMMLLAGQNKVVFTGSNFGDGDVRPYQPYVNYVDGAWYFSDDPAVVNSFRTRYDDTWTNTALYGNYANISGPLTRKYPTYPIDPAMNFLPNPDVSQDYGRRAISQIDQESQKIDLIMYRLTDTSICDAALRAVARGVQVRLLAEPREYRFDSSRLGAELSGPYNVDRLYAAGVQIKMRKHLGLNHQKSVLLYGRGMTIFGSSNWSWESFNYQEEHNYFTTKPWFFQWFANQFERKWASQTEFEPFVPLAPDSPVNLSPADGATVEPTPLTLRWEGGPWAHKYDIYVGPDAGSLSLIASDVSTGTAGTSASESYAVSGLQPGMTYYWRVVGKTMANQTATGPVWRFTTTGIPSQGPTVTSVSPNSGPVGGGTAVTITGSRFSPGASVTIGGAAATNVNVTGSTSITAVTPAHAAGTVNVVVANGDGLSGSLAGGYTYVSAPPPSPSASEIVLYASEAAVRAGGWVNEFDATAAGGARIYLPDSGAAKLTTPLASPTHYFEMSFSAEAGRAYRIWMRGKADNNNWGNDSVFIQFSDSVSSTGSAVYRIGTTSATEYNLEDCSGCGLSGWGWQDNGWGAGVMGPLIYFQSTGTHTLRVQVREDGLAIDQIVLSASAYLNASPGALKNDSNILPKTSVPPPAPSVSGVTPNSGSTSGGTSVTITGTSFSSGVTVSFGGAAATSVSIVNGTTITAVTPAHAAGAVDVVVRNADNQSGTLPGGFTYALANTGETILLADDFNNTSLDTSKWTANNLFSGFTDTGLQLAEVNQRLEIGPMLRNASGSHYNGIRSAGTYNFSGAYCYVELVQAAASNTASDAMFTMGKDVSNYYRIFVEAGKLVLAKAIGGTKSTLLKVSYDVVNHRYWRIRHNSATGAVVFEMAADSGGSPGAWVQQYSEAWSVTAVPLTSVQFELKGGTWQAEANAAGKVIFDNFKVARP